MGPGSYFHDPLSPQERRVLILVMDGQTNKQIASALGVSEGRVSQCLVKVFRKLKVKRRAQAVAEWLRLQRAAGAPP
jgi:DNA-binding CsgD family transcriptional regulator